MKDDLIGAYVTFRGRLAKVVSHNGGQFSYGLEYVEPNACPNCGHNLGVEQFEIIRSSRLWADSVKPVATLPHAESSGNETDTMSKTATNAVAEVGI